MASTTLLLLTFLRRDFWPPVVLRSVATASLNAVDLAPTALPVSVSALVTMAAGLAVVVECSASLVLALEFAGPSKHSQSTPVEYNIVDGYRIDCNSVC